MLMFVFVIMERRFNPKGAVTALIENVTREQVELLYATYFHWSFRISIK